MKNTDKNRVTYHDEWTPVPPSEILRALSHPCPLDVVVGLLLEGIAEYSGPLPKSLKELKNLFGEIVTEKLADEEFRKACRAAASGEMKDFGSEIVRRLFIIIRDHKNPGLTCDVIARAFKLSHVQGVTTRQMADANGVSHVAVIKRTHDLKKELGLNEEDDQ